MRNMIKVVLILIILLLISLLLPKISPILSTLIGIGVNVFIAAGFAYVSYPVLKWFNSKGFNTIVSSILTLLIFASVFIVSALLIVQLVWPQILSAVDLLQKSTQNYSWLKDNPELERVYKFLTPYFDRFSQSMLNYFANFTQDIISKSTRLIADVALIFALYLYMLFDAKSLVEKIKIKLKFGSKKYNFVKDLNNEYVKYLKAVLLIIFITVIEYGIVYSLIGHPNWLALTALSAFSNLIPYFGGIIVNIIALATSIFVSMDLFLMVSACVIILPTIEGNIINPMVHKKTSRISPIILLPAIFIGGSIFGFLGIVLAIPAIIFYKVFKRHFADDVNILFRRIWG